MTPEQIVESAKRIQRPNESLSQACVRAALYLRLYELTPQWKIPDVGFDI